MVHLFTQETEELNFDDCNHHQCSLTTTSLAVFANFVSHFGFYSFYTVILRTGPMFLWFSQNLESLGSFFCLEVQDPQCRNSPNGRWMFIRTHMLICTTKHTHKYPLADLTLWHDPLLYLNFPTILK